MKTYTLKPIENTKNKNVNEFLNELNPAQREAVEFGNGPLLVIAGAGSGKTKTLVYRVARLVASGVNPESILLLTFTRKSSQEMLERATRVLDNRCTHVSGGTFHSFSHLILRQFGQHLGLTDHFTIMDRSDSEDMVAMIRKELGFGELNKRFPKKSTVTTILSKSANTQDNIEAIVTKEYAQFLEFAPEIKRIQNHYEQHKFAMQTLDYDDLLIKCRDLLKNHPDIRTQIQNTYEYILVDEYQDTNTIQAEIVYLMANQSQNVMVVGDDAQSIYSFRGASFKNIMDFPKQFPATKIIMLEENYRSSQPILDLTNAVIARAKDKYTKNLFTKKKEGLKPVYIETNSENEQSKLICQKVLELREEGIELNKIAVLIRSGWHSNDLEVELKAHSIPFAKYGGFKFAETSHVKDVISFCRVIYNPVDALSWQRILLFIDGLGPKAASEIISHIQQNKANLKTIIWDSFKKRAYYPALVKIYSYLTSFDSEKQKPAEILEQTLKIYEPFFKLKYDDHPKRSPDLDSLTAIAARYNDLSTFLTEMSLEPPDASQIGTMPENHDNERLVLSTIHSAKGLEWHTVFILSAVDGYLPSFQSIGDMAQLEEERRLLYVALTRAQEQLFILKPHLDHTAANYYRFSHMHFSKISRFLEENDIIHEYTEKWAVVAEPRFPTRNNEDSNLPSYLRNSAPTKPKAPFQTLNPNRKKYFF